MLKRNKRVMDYARYKAIKDRGDKVDKKTAEQGEQYIAVNDTLKEELPKLFALTGKLVEACLNNFVQLQLQWQGVWRRKLSQAIDDNKVPTNVNENHHSICWRLPVRRCSSSLPWYMQWFRLLCWTLQTLWDSCPRPRL